MFRLLFVFPLFWMIACEQQNQNAEAENEDPVAILKEEAIALHDDIMPLMGPIDNLRKQLNTQSDQIVDKGLASAEAVSDLSGRLFAANERMMKWMNQYSTEVSRKGGDVSLESMQKLRDEISQLKVEMETVKTEAETLVARL